MNQKKTQEISNTYLKHIDAKTDFGDRNIFEVLNYLHRLSEKFLH